MSLAQSDRNRCGRGISVFVYVYPNLIHRHLQTLSSGSDDTVVSLMREQHIQLFRLHIRLSQSTLCSLAHNLNSEFEYFLTVHMNGVVFCSNGFFACRITAAACRLQQELAAVAVGTHVNAQYTVAFFNLANYSSTGAITEENAGVTIGPVHNTAQSFRTDNQNLVIQTALNHLACYSKAVNKTATACSQVKGSCVFSTQTSLYQAGSGRENVIAGSSTYDNEVQLFRSNAGVLQCFYSSIVRQIGGCFFRSSDVTLLDAGALSNPFVTGLNNFLHVCISDNLLRNIMS